MRTEKQKKRKEPQKKELRNYQDWIVTNRKALFILVLNVLTLLVLAGNISFDKMPGRNFVAATAGQSCNSTKCTAGCTTWCDCCNAFEICCDVVTKACNDPTMNTNAGACYAAAGTATTGYSLDALQQACVAGYTAPGTTWLCDSSATSGSVCRSGYIQTMTNHTWFGTGATGNGENCCGDDGTGDDFYLLDTVPSPDVCQACSNGVVQTNGSCIGDGLGCDSEGVLRYDNGSTCITTTSCNCYYGEDCASTGYTAPSADALPANCSQGGFYNDANANCYHDSGDRCYYRNIDPCEVTGLIYSSAACFDAGTRHGYSCYYDNGESVDESDSCGTTGCTGVGNDSTSAPVTCTSGNISESNANCFVNGAASHINGTCYYDTTDPCDADIDGWDFGTSTACADEGNESADTKYCYYDEGCTTSGANTTCSSGEKKPFCDAGDMTSSEADCEMDNGLAGGIDVCAWNGGDACAADNDGWDYDNDSHVDDGEVVDCTTCGDSGYQADFTNDDCYFGPITCTNSGWGTVSSENCFTWCWAQDLTTANCFGSQTQINRTQPENATTCYYSRTCTDSENGCGWTSTTGNMRRDYCDQCEPTGVTQGSQCPPVNSSCASNCANSGTIWHGSAANNITRCSNTNTSCVIATDTLTKGDVWDSATPATCDDTECNLDCNGEGSVYGTCVGGATGTCTCGGPDCSNGCLFVLDSSGNNVTIFDTTGNVYLKGSLTQSDATGEDGNDLLFRSSTDTTIAWIDDSTGNMKITGKTTGGDCVGVPADSFKVQDSSENIVAFISDNGTLCAEGTIYEDAGV